MFFLTRLPSRRWPADSRRPFPARRVCQRSVTTVLEQDPRRRRHDFQRRRPPRRPPCPRARAEAARQPACAPRRDRRRDQDRVRRDWRHSATNLLAPGRWRTASCTSLASSAQRSDSIAIKPAACYARRRPPGWSGGPRDSGEQAENRDLRFALKAKVPAMAGMRRYAGTDTGTRGGNRTGNTVQRPPTGPSGVVCQYHTGDRYGGDNGRTGRALAPALDSAAANRRLSGGAVNRGSTSRFQKCPRSSARRASGGVTAQERSNLTLSTARPVTPHTIPAGKGGDCRCDHVRSRGPRIVARAAAGLPTVGLPDSLLSMNCLRTCLDGTPP